MIVTQHETTTTVTELELDPQAMIAECVMQLLNDANEPLGPQMDAAVEQVVDALAEATEEFGEIDQAIWLLGVLTAIGNKLAELEGDQ